MSCDTVGESFPSKYQQIKWIVSLQLISPVPQKDAVDFRFFLEIVHLVGQNRLKKAYSNSLKMKEKSLTRLIVPGLTGNFTAAWAEPGPMNLIPVG